MSKLKVLVLALSILLILILAEATGCEPVAPLEVRNGTSEIITLVVIDTTKDYIPEYGRIPVCKIEPGEICRPKHIARFFDNFLIEAKDTQGNIVYSKVFTRQELEDIHWQVTITESGN